MDQEDLEHKRMIKGLKKGVWKVPTWECNLNYTSIKFRLEDVGQNFNKVLHTGKSK